MVGLRYLAIALGLGIGSFIYQYFKLEPDYLTAFKQAYDQSFAVLSCYILEGRR